MYSLTGLFSSMGWYKGFSTIFALKEEEKVSENIIFYWAYFPFHDTKHVVGNE